MHLHLRHVRGASFFTIVGCIAGLAITGCTKQSEAPGGLSALPQTPLAAPALAKGTEPMLGTIAVDRRQADSVMELVTAAATHHYPARHLAPEQVHPKDLTDFGGPVMTSGAAYDIYVNGANGAPWGNPASFSERLAPSAFIHLVDQYIGQTTNNRYTYAGGFTVAYDTSKPVLDKDIYNILRAVVPKAGGAGYTTMYHIFLHKDVGQCDANACYPDYCAYHGAVNLTGIGHVLYSVEPYQFIQGCKSPSDTLRDSTDTTLEHEIFETITDPDVQTKPAWYNDPSGEIADLCNDSGEINLGGVVQIIQREYSNKYHRCTFEP